MLPEATLKEDQLNDKVVNEEYKIWKKQSPFLYDICLVKALDWPSLSLDWFKFPLDDQPRDFITSNLLLSTVNAGHLPGDHIYKALVDLPIGSDEESTKLHNFIDPGQKIATEGPVIAARTSPANPSLVATISQAKQLNIYQTDDFPTSQPVNDAEPAKPTKTLEFHTKEGTSVAWHPTDSSLLASAARDNHIAVWDWTKSETPTATFESDSVFNEIEYQQPHVLAGINENGAVYFYDLRETSRAPFSFRAHDLPGRSLSVSPHNAHKLATGSDDSTVKVWDIRQPREPTNVLKAHFQQVRSVRWSPHEASVLASSGDDRRVKLWDLSNAGLEQSAEEENEGPPELIFIHGGHVDKVSHVEWHPTLPWVLASSSEDNIVQVWQPATSIVNGVGGA